MSTRSGNAVKRRTQEERSAATRRLLIDAAVGCIAERGLADATLAAIAGRAGLTRGAVQHHYGARSELLLAVADEFGKELFVRARIQDAAALPVAERVSRICRRYWDIFSSRHFLAVVQVQLGTQSAPDINREVLDRIRQFEVELDRQWVVLFADCRIPPARLAVARHVVLGTMRGLALRKVYLKDRDRSAGETAMLEEMLLHILAQRPA